MQENRERSSVWYLLPIFLGLIGGLIAYFVIRRDDPRKAKNCLYLGIIMAVIGIILNFVVLTQIPELEQGFRVNV